MLKEVGASGQISLGKRYAGCLYDAVFYPDGRIELVPMKAVPAMQDPAGALTGVVDDGDSRFGSPEVATTARNAEESSRLAAIWEAENKEAIEAYNQRVERDRLAAERLGKLRKT